MRTLAILITFAALLPASAAAKERWRLLPPAPVSMPACPAGIPVQTITVINQANVRPDRLALVERAAVDQSLQVRRWWGTPCVTFAPGGWKLYLKAGAFNSTGGEHFSESGAPYILAWTGRLAYEMWSTVFTHEIIETLVDPTAGRDYTVDHVGYQLEIADPVETRTYRLAGVNVSDFVTPNWYAGATSGTCAAIPDLVSQHFVCGPAIAATPNAGPWDQARALQRPWQQLGSH